MKTLPLSGIFEPTYGNKFDLNKMTLAAGEMGVAFVSRTRKNLGVVAYVEQIEGVDPYPAGCLTIALGGVSVLETFVQQRPFYTGQNVAVLKPLASMTDEEKLFYCLCIKHNRHRYNGFGREANRTFRSLPLPARSEIPSWVYTDRPERRVSSAARKDGGPPALDTATWKPFTLRSLFDIKKGKRLTKAAMKPGATPFIGAIDSNNGLTGFIDRPPLHPAGSITVNYNGNGVAEAYYQPRGFWCSDDVNVLYPKFDLSVEGALFVCALIRQEKYRFSYGRKWHLDRMNDAEIRLPVNATGAPDWVWIEGFMAKLPYSEALGLPNDTSKLSIRL